MATKNTKSLEKQAEETTDETRTKHRLESSVRICVSSVAPFFVLFVLFVATCSADPPVRLTTDGLLKQRPAWSPDGTQLSFTRHQGATIFLFVRSADGSERRL